METTEMIMIGSIIFVIIAFIITLIYILQPQNMKSSNLFRKKKKQPLQNKATGIGPNNTQIEVVTTSIDTLALKPILKSYDLETFNRLSAALKNKDVIVFPKILFSEFISIQKIVAKQDNEFYNVLPYLRADFLICKASNCRPICIIRDTKVPTENAYKAYMKKIAEKMNINYLEVEGINDATIADIYRNIH